MRIWHQSFIVLDDVPAYTDRVRRHLDRVKRPDTVVDLHGLLPQTYPTNYPGVDFGYSFLFGMHSLQWPANAAHARREPATTPSPCARSSIRSIARSRPSSIFRWSRPARSASTSQACTASVSD